MIKFMGISKTIILKKGSIIYSSLLLTAVYWGTALGSSAVERGYSWSSVAARVVAHVPGAWQPQSVLLALLVHDCTHISRSTAQLALQWHVTASVPVDSCSLVCWGLATSSTPQLWGLLCAYSQCFIFPHRGCIGRGACYRVHPTAGFATPPKPTVDRPFILSEGLPPVPHKLAARTLRGEYMDMAELLCDNLEAQRRAAATTSSSTSSTTPKGRREVPDILSWVQCFSIYMAVITSKFPHRIKELLEYQTLIVREARHVEERGGWPMTRTFASKWLVMSLPTG